LSMKSKVLFIVDDFYPVNAAPAVRINSFIKEIKGHSVEVLGGFREDKVQTDVKYHKVSRPPEKNPISFVKFLLEINWRAYKLAKREKFDTIVVSIPKYELLLCFPLLKKHTNRLILDVRDSFQFIQYGAYLRHFLPQFFAQWLGKMIKTKLVASWFRKALLKADLITVANKGIEQSLSRFSNKVELISNGVDTNHFKPSKEKKGPMLNLVYVGNFAEKDRFELILEGLPEFHEKVKLHLIGYGRNKEKLIQSLRESKVDFIDHGMVPHEKLPSILNKMDLGFIFRDQDVQESIPVSIYEFASMNIPVFTNSVGVMRQLVKEHNLGFIINTKAEFQKELNKILSNQGEKSSFEDLHKLAKEKFSREKQAKKFVQLL
jgi:glycosyltransferase involved in cell wall biosynthesis